MNSQYSSQLRALEEEKSAALSELSSLQKALDDAIARERNDKQQTQQLQMYVVLPCDAVNLNDCQSLKLVAFLIK